MDDALELAGIAVRGVSEAGVRTVIELPGLDLAFDMGTCPRSAVRRSTVLFTHAHVDHMGALASHCATRALMGMKPPTYIVPRAVEADVHDLLDAWRRLDFSEMPCRVVPLDPGESRTLGRGLVVRPFRAVHRVPAQGYVIWRRRSRLRADLVGQDPAEIAAARQRGEAVSEWVEEPLVAFSGDTRIDALDREPSVWEARLLILEVTFFDGRVSVERARGKGHVHLDEVVRRARRFHNQAVLFTHRSLRYSLEEAEAIVDRRLPAELRERVRLLA